LSVEHVWLRLNGGSATELSVTAIAEGLAVMLQFAPAVQLAAGQNCSIAGINFTTDLVHFGIACGWKSALRDFEGRDRPLAIVTSDGNSQAVKFVKPYALDRPGFSVGKHHGSAEELRLRLLERAKDL
jgi:hypothetical protein